MKPEPVTCGKCGYEFQSRSPHPQCRKCRSYDVLYVSMLSRAKLQSVRVLANDQSHTSAIADSVRSQVGQGGQDAC